MTTIAPPPQCPKGHDLVYPNVGTDPRTGKRRCRACEPTRALKRKKIKPKKKTKVAMRCGWSGTPKCSIFLKHRGLCQAPAAIIRAAFAGASTADDDHAR